ncbi:MAG: MoaD/ThiS family protein [Pyrinomonadaceae bacterium]
MTGTVKILFFGATADITGERHIHLTIPKDMIAKSIFDDLLSRFPELFQHRLLYALNQQYATGKEIVRDGDELAIFTAVSGG